MAAQADMVPVTMLSGFLGAGVRAQLKGVPGVAKAALAPQALTSWVLCPIDKPDTASFIGTYPVWCRQNNPLETPAGKQRPQDRLRGQRCRQRQHRRKADQGRPQQGQRKRPKYNHRPGRHHRAGQRLCL